MYKMCALSLWLEYALFCYLIHYIFSLLQNVEKLSGTEQCSVLECDTARVTFSRSIMSGDSPNAHRSDIFFKDGRSSPAPTTSKDIGVQNTGEVVTASVLVEPNKDDTIDMCSPILNPGYKDEKRSDLEETFKLEDARSSDKHDNNRHEKSKLNGDPDKLDGVWNMKNGKKEQDPDDEDNCVVQCLYYTMQCCECTII